ncbi:MAG: hypothetical protein JNK11_02445 [Alphaproteobacteria bacterium]|nr:hypothetical protein [Alphaproteobacteria bacterium]
MQFKELGREQQDVRDAARALFAAWDAAHGELTRDYQAAIGWKDVEGKPHLVRKEPDGPESDLGPRSPHTEELFQRFTDGRAALRARMHAMEHEIQKKAAAVRDADLGRLPRTGALVLRRLDRQGLLGAKAVLAGSSALFAYEAGAGVSLALREGARDSDGLIPDADKRLRLGTIAWDAKSLAEHLHHVDATFAPGKGGRNQAVNGAGFTVSWVPMPAKPRQRDPRGPHDVNWLLTADTFEAIGFDEGGLPTRLVAPDPRAFALHKLWLSERADRPAEKKARDRAQAIVAGVLARRFLRLAFAAEDLRLLPVAVLEEGVTPGAPSRPKPG